MKSNKQYIKAVIVDDSAQSRKLLQLMIKELAEDFLILGEAENVNDAVTLIKKQKPDIVFLDIEMPGKSGLHLVDEISRDEISYNIIFTTAYNEYAIKAFRLSAIDYLLKPIDEKHLEEALNKARKLKKLTNNSQKLELLKHNLSDKQKILCISMQNGHEFVLLDNIEYLEADGSYVTFHIINDKPKISAKNLKHFESILNSYPTFFRAHRSFLINLQHVKKYESGKIITASGAKIDLARERKKEFLKLFKAKA